MQASHFGMRIQEVPARGRYFEDASSVGPAQRHRLRPEDALDRDSPRAAPSADRSRRGSSSPRRRGSTRVEPRGHGRARRHVARRLQPDLAAPRRRLRAERAVPRRPAACSTSAAGSATATRCSPRGRPSGSTSTQRCSTASSGRPWPPTCAGCRSPAASFDGAIAVHSIEHVPDPERALAEIARVLRPGAPAVLVTPNRLTFARADEIIDPYHYVEYDRARARGAVRAAVFESVEMAGLIGLGALPGARGARAREARPAAPAGPAAPAAAGAARGAPGALRPAPEA